MRFFLNDRLVETDAPTGMAVLDWVRETAGLTGTKQACREGDCGSCLVLLGEPAGGGFRYRGIASCLLPLGELANRHLVTIEGLNGDTLSPIQRAMVDEGASQCGYCTPGIVVALTDFLCNTTTFDAREADIAIAGNLCRCTGYGSIRRAVARLIEDLRDAVDPAEDRLTALVREGVLPPHFESVEDQLASLVEEARHHEPWVGSPLVAGGTDLYVQQLAPLEQTDPRFISRVLPPRIWSEEEFIYLSGSTTAEDLKRSDTLREVISNIEDFVDLICSQPIRHRATVAGNIVNASPIGDMTIMLLGLDAELGLARDGDRRTVPLRSFFHGYKEFDLRSIEIIEWIRFPSRRRTALYNFEKVSKRKYLDIASVNSAACFHLNDDTIVEAHLSAGGVAPIPLKLDRTEAFLAGRAASAETARGAAEIAVSEISPISDVRGSAAYKRLLLGQLVLAHFQVVFGIEDGLLTEATA